VQVDSIITRVESAPGICNQRLKLKCDEPLSNVAFNFNLRRYSVVSKIQISVHVERTTRYYMVGQCRVTVSKPELTARLVSAISA
jgi:hypothetical protein